MENILILLVKGGANMKEKIEMNFQNEDMVNFIQDNAQSYMYKFEKMKEKNKLYSWNWAAFLVSVFWFVYRKMYALGIGVIVLEIVLESIFKVRWVSYIVFILCGIFGNYLYLNHCNRKLSKIVNLDPSDKESELLRQGGVSIWALLVMIIMIVLIAVTCAYISVMYLGK